MFVVAEAFPPIAGQYPYGLLTTDGSTYYFEHDTQLRPGDSFGVRFDSYDRQLGTTVRGVYSPARMQPPRRGAVFDIVILVWLTLTIVVMVFFLVAGLVWAAQSQRAIHADRGAEPVTVAGRYEGSWIPRNLLSRSPRSRVTGATGFPVGLKANAHERIMWFAAPMREAERVKQFEIDLRRTSREVTIGARPHTRTILTIDGPGGLHLDLRPAADSIDLSDPTTGIGLPRPTARPAAILAIVAVGVLVALAVLIVTTQTHGSTFHKFHVVTTSTSLP